MRWLLECTEKSFRTQPVVRFAGGSAISPYICQVMADVLGETEPAADDIAAKRAMLLRHGVALWDVIESCEVRGSSDASIRDVVPADVARITRVAPVRAVVCNGGTAGRLYRRWLEPVTGLAAEVLPSTSPANAAWSAERLAERWREVLLAALDTLAAD